MTTLQTTADSLRPNTLRGTDSPEPLMNQSLSTESRSTELSSAESRMSEMDSIAASPISQFEAYRQWASAPLAEQPVVSVVIPAYNETQRILPTIGAIAAYMSARGEPWELIVADDGSTDDTVAVLQQLGLANMRVLVADRNGGKGKAVRRGVLAALGDYVLFADADQSTPIEQFELLLDPLLSGRFDISIGSRAGLSAETTRKSLLRRALSKGLQVLVRVGFRIDTKDTQCGFKLFTKTVALDLFSLQRTDGFSFDLELLYLAAKRGYRTIEVPVEWIDAPGSKVDATKVSIAFFVDLCKIRFNDLRGLYGSSQLPNIADRLSPQDSR
jgi:dolichyl-phosphate beta-glucosyltransferase